MRSEKTVICGIDDKEAELFHIGEMEAHWNVNGTRILKYSISMSHLGLKEYKSISDQDIDILEHKANLQANKWLGKWRNIEGKESNLKNANLRTEEIQELIGQINNILIHTLSINDTVDWESLRKNEEYPHAKPMKSDLKPIPSKPVKAALEFTPKFTIWDLLITSRKQKKIACYQSKYADAVKLWEQKIKNIQTYNENIEKTYSDGVKEWEKQKELFYQKQKEYNDKIDKMKDSYFHKNGNSITEYCEMVLNNSEYPDAFPQNFEIEYNPDNEILIVEYQLPSIECFPAICEVKYIASKKEFKETKISDVQRRKMFDDTMYKIALRSIHELFEADTVNALQAVSFNGWVKAINKATGKEENNCILSIQVTKNEFLQVELANVDPKTCFKSLKGVASSKLSSLTPIQPLLQISKTDKRFVDGYNVVDSIDQTTNMAAMDWEDFEHLIRELFEKVFSANGGEVKVTQASRDGGVDAVAFDPDPIRGGKIVIQAKRYTNTVGVSAVRDLYGTVVNEGATKGILVTTADYGPDAYGFAKGKPLTLLNGSNLLHLLEEHGHHVKIDLKEAKKILSANEN